MSEMIAMSNANYNILVEIVNGVIGNGGPSGVFDTLQELKDRYPKGAKGVYLVTADGKWYYWNNEWLAGGVYQATQLSDGSVTEVKLEIGLRDKIDSIESVKKTAEKANTDLASHKSSNQAHNASAITYSGNVSGVSNTKQAIDSLQTQNDSTNQRVSMIIGNNGDGKKDSELLDIRIPDPSYTPQREINDAGDLTRDIQKQLVDTQQEVEEVRTLKKPFSNTDGAVTAMLNVGLTYINRTNIVYGNNYTPFSDLKGTTDGKYEMDCSSFVQCCVTGTTYENCRYFNSQNIYDESFYPLIDRSRNYGRMLAHHIAKYCYDNGMSYAPYTDWSNARVGDLIFLSNNYDEGFWRDIGHVMIVSRIDQKADSITVIECVSGFASAVVENTYTKAQLNGSKHAYLCGRIPLNDTTINSAPINYDATVSTTSTTSVARRLTTYRTLKINTMYTLFFKADFPIGAYPLIRFSASNTIYSFSSSVIKRPDQMYKVNFYIPEGKLEYQTQIDIQIAGGSGTSTVTYAALYEGYLTVVPKMIDLIKQTQISKQNTLTKSETIEANSDKLVDFSSEINAILDNNYLFTVEVTVGGTLASKVSVTINQPLRKQVLVVNRNASSVTVDVIVTITQVLKSI